MSLNRAGKCSRFAWTALVSAICVGFIQSPVTAQALSARDTEMSFTSLQAAPNALTRSSRVNLDVQNVSLDNALQRLVRAGAPLVYPTSLVANVRSVTCRCRDVTLAHALQTLLEGTLITYREIATTGQIALVPAPPSTPPPLKIAAGTVRGRAIERSNGAPIVSAAVHVAGTDRGALTNADGRYIIPNVPAGTYWVRATRIGLRPDSQQVRVEDNGTAEANFALSVDPVTMNPLDVTISTGSIAATERKKVGNSIAVITADEIVLSGARDLPELLRGRVLGVDVMRNSGANGTGGNITVRGVSSIIQDQTPLVYVDGVPVDVGASALNGRGLNGPDKNVGSQLRIDELNLDQVERIEIIKGPAATTLYGTQGINGVIQIFTKRGVPGQTRIIVSMEQGTSKLRRDDDFAIDLAYRDAFLSQFRNPRLQEYHAALTGGSGDISYSVGATHNRDDGYIPNNGEQRTSVATSFRVVPNERLSVQLSGNLVQRHFESAALYGGSNRVSLQNFLATAPVTDTDVGRMYGSLAVSFMPLPYWQNRLTVGIDDNSEVNERVGLSGTPATINRDRTTRDFRRTSANFVSTLSYPREGRITSTLSVGGEANHDETTALRIQGIGLPDVRTIDFDLATTISGGALGQIPTDRSTKVAQVGGFIQEQLGFGDRLFLTAGLRVDGNSSFGDDFGLQTYPKLAASYVLQPRQWWNAKLRTAWGKSGQAPPPFAKDLSFTLSRPQSGAQSGQPIVILLDPGNSNLRPEIGTEWEIGVENYFFGNRAAFEINYFRETTKDAHIRAPLPLSSGFASGPLANVGQLRSKGLEAAVRVTPYDTRSSSVEIGFTLTHLFESGLITELGSDPVLTTTNQGFDYGTFQGLQEGFSVRDLYYTSVFTDTTHPPYTGREIIRVGSRVPTTYGGVNLTARFLERARLYANMIYNAGGYGFDLNRFDVDRTLGYLGATTSYSNNAFPREFQDRYVFRTDQIRLDIVRLVYQLPTSIASRFARAREAEFWVEGSNMMSWDVFDRGDPEAVPVESSAFGYTGQRPLVAPRPQMYKAGVRMTF